MGRSPICSSAPSQAASRPLATVVVACLLSAGCPISSCSCGSSAVLTAGTTGAGGGLGLPWGLGLGFGLGGVVVGVVVVGATGVGAATCDVKGADGGCTRSRSPI